MNEVNYVIGVDYGTDSVRSVLVDAANGKEISSAVFFYPRWQKGLYCNPSLNQFRQHPLDYIEGLTQTITSCLDKAGGKEIANSVRSIAVDTTGSTPIAVNEIGTPLSLIPGFEENPNAMFVLWKDHTGIKEANEINAHADKICCKLSKICQAVIIHQNGSGLNYCMYCVRIKPLEKALFLG